MDLSSIPLWEILILIIAGFVILVVLILWYFFGYNYAITDITQSIEKVGNSTVGLVSILSLITS